MYRNKTPPRPVGQTTLPHAQHSVQTYRTGGFVSWNKDVFFAILTHFWKIHVQVVSGTVSVFRSANWNFFLQTFEFIRVTWFNIRPKTHIPAIFCQVQFSTSIKFVFKLEIWNYQRNFTKPYNETAFQTQKMAESLTGIFCLICFLAHRSATRVISRETRFRLEIVWEPKIEEHTNHTLIL